MTSICQKCGGAGITAMIIGAAFILSCPVDIKKEKCPYLPHDVHTHQEIYIPRFQNMIADNNTATMASSSTQPYHDSIIGR